MDARSIPMEHVRAYAWIVQGWIENNDVGSMLRHWYNITDEERNQWNRAQFQHYFSKAPIVQLQYPQYPAQHSADGSITPVGE